MSASFPQTYSLRSNNNITQECSVFVGLVVDGVLDTAKLRSAHEELVRLWPAVGGKLITSTTPFSFTTGSIVDFGTRTLSKKMKDIPELIDFSSASSAELSYYTVHKKSDKIFHYDTMQILPFPTTLLAIRATILEDATLLGFRLAHHLFDGQGSFSIVEAYADLINGKRNSIPQLIPPPDIDSPLSKTIEGEDDLPKSVKLNNPFVHPSSNYTATLMGYFMFLGATLLTMIKPKVGAAEREVEKMVHIPGEAVEKLRQRCQEELDRASERGDLEEGSGLQLTKNDVIAAWFNKCAYELTPPSKRPIELMYKFNYRPFLPPPPENTLYLRNSFYGMRVHFDSLSEFQTLSLALIALEIRLCCIRNKQPSAIRDALKFWEDHSKSHISPIPPDSSPFKLALRTPLFSHWTTFEYNRLEFSGGFVRGDSKGDGKVLFTQPLIALPFHTTVKPIGINLKDGKGGYWLRGNLWESGWDGYRERMDL